MSDVQYYAQWEEAPDPSVEQLTGDTLEWSRRVSHVKELREEREEQARREELEELAEIRALTAPTLSEVFEKYERHSRATDYSTERADQKERLRLQETGGADYDPADLRDLKAKNHGRGVRKEEYRRKRVAEILEDRARARGDDLPEPPTSPVPPSQAAIPVREPDRRWRWPWQH